MVKVDTLFPENGLTDRERDTLLQLLLDRENLTFIRKYGTNLDGREFEEFALQQYEGEK